jgi:hypothetical protein
MSFPESTHAVSRPLACAAVDITQDFQGPRPHAPDPAVHAVCTGENLPQPLSSAASMIPMARALTGTAPTRDPTRPDQIAAMASISIMKSGP